MQKKLPLYYFPPTICWIDDNQFFLEAAYNLFNNDYKCLTFTDPQEALEFLCSYKVPLNNVTREFSESDIFDTYNHLPVDININEITKLVNIQDRKDEIGIIIIDNNMPNINGLELCYQLRNFPFKKILLTGETSPNKVIDAFNQGIIDKFIVKGGNLSVKLQENITELSFQYFHEKTKNLIAHLEASRLSPLSDPLFVEFFHNCAESNQAKEFYLINRHGSFLMKRDDGASIYFIVMTESGKNEFLKLHDDAYDEVGDLLSQVSRGEALPFFGIGREYWEYNFSEWKNYFYPSNIIQGREKYYWTTINNKETL